MNLLFLHSEGQMAIEISDEEGRNSAAPFRPFVEVFEFDGHPRIVARIVVGFAELN
jgi:hypothetical protein